MSEQRTIAYKSVGFSLGAGSGGGAGSALGTAASSFLNTLFTSVPSAKSLLPTLVSELSIPKSATQPDAAAEQNDATQRRSEKQDAKQSEKRQEERQLGNVSIKHEQVQEQRQKDEPEQAPLGQKEAPPSLTGPTLEVINLLSDSDEDLTQGTPAKQPAAAAQDAKAAPDTAAEPPTKPVNAEYIPLPKLAAPAAAAAAAAGAAGTSADKAAPAPGSADALAEEENIRKLGQRPYWMSYVSRIESPLLRLHQELVELCELVQPTPDEAEARRASVAAVSEVVNSIWPNARCEIFGSYATGLYVPTSDVDLVILDSGCSNVQAGLKALAAALTKRNVGRAIQVIGKARVPIVKFETVEYGNLAFDVSFDVANGPQAAQLVSEMTAAWPMMRPLILCLKLFLQQRELNEVYTGGIGSYALITLVAAFLQLHASRRPSRGAAADRDMDGEAEEGGGGKRRKREQPQQDKQQQQQQPVHGTAGAAASGSESGAVEPGLGALLVDFFRFYGRVINMPEVGISCAGGGQFFRKTDKDSPPGGQAGGGSYSGWLNCDRPFLLAVEDPKDPDNDVCRSSFNIMRVKTAFEFAYQMLTAPSHRDESLLSRILRLGPILASRPRPRVPHLRDLGYYAQPPQPAARRQREQEEDEREAGRQQQQRVRGREQKQEHEEGEAPEEGEET
ncbi:hypothetical protein Agub_g3555, partial [Astrephomene gubernaculifera]